MKAILKRDGISRETGVVRAFVSAILINGRVEPSLENPNTPGTLDNFDDDSLKLLVEEGRIQIERQTERYRHATDRGQIVLTVDLAVLGFQAALLMHLLDTQGFKKVVVIVIWTMSVFLSLLATTTAAGVVAVGSTFDGIDTTQVSTMSPPILKELAHDYSRAVRRGELVVDLRLTAFQRATVLTMWSAFVVALAFVVAT